MAGVSTKRHEDYGFFGPGSVAWRVWGYPTSLTVGFQRAVVVEELDPFLLASVEATNRVRTQARPLRQHDPLLRHRRVRGLAHRGGGVGDADAGALADGGDRASVGLQYDANDPDSQLWILLTGWHSVLYAYERYGPGRLSPEDERELLGGVRGGGRAPDLRPGQGAAHARGRARVLRVGPSRGWPPPRRRRR